MSLNWLDFVIIGAVVLSALVGLARGLIREVVSVGVWIAAIVVAWLLHAQVAELLVPYLSQGSVRLAIAFIALILATLVLGAILGAMLSVVIEKTGLSGLDRLLGLGFGAARGVIIVAMAVFLMNYTPITQDAWWQESQLVSQFEQVAAWLIELVPPEIQAQIRNL